MSRPISVIDAPSNLGLRPPAPGVVPGVYKLAGALRDAGIVSGLRALDAGVVVPPRYHSAWDGKTVRNATAISRYSHKLADRIASILSRAEFPVVLGGDCSILLGNALALRRAGRYGLVYVDGHLDFRHPGNSPSVGAAGGEALALVTGRGAAGLTDPDGLGPLVSTGDVVAIGWRGGDEHEDEVRSLGISAFDSSAVRSAGAREIARRATDHFGVQGVAGFWIHVDADVVDRNLLPAVDSPEPGGLDFDELSELIEELALSPLATGIEVTIFDPDLDEDGSQAAALAGALVAALEPLRESGSA